MGAETTFAMHHTSGWMNEMQFTKQSVVEIFHDFHTFPINSHELFWTVYESVNAPEKPKETAAKLLFWKSVQELENIKQTVLTIGIYWSRKRGKFGKGQIIFHTLSLYISITSQLYHCEESKNKISETIFNLKNWKISVLCGIWKRGN